MKIHIDKKGSWQTGQVGVPLQPLQVCVQDDEGIPVHKLEVRFRLVQGKGRFTHRDAETDAAGCAVAEFVPETAGLYRVDCLVGGRGGRQTQFTGSAVEAAPAPAEETPATDPATTAAPQPPVAEVALFEEEIEKFVQAEAAGPDPIDETAAVEPMVTTDTAEPTADPPADVPPPPAAVDPDSVDAFLDSLLQSTETSSARPEQIGPASEPAMTPEPIGIVDEPGTAEQPKALPPLPDEPVVMEEAPPRLADLPLPPLPAEEPAVEPAQPPAEAVEVPNAPDQPQPEELTPASEPEQGAPKRLGKLDLKQKIGLAGLALLIAFILFCLVRLPGTSKPAAPALLPGTVDCTGSTIKAVGQTYVFEGCRKVP